MFPSFRTFILSHLDAMWCAIRFNFLGNFVKKNGRDIQLEKTNRRRVLSENYYILGLQRKWL